ncbi:hypothetical protein OSTOST_25818 [Ostertagia ostertagi]
MPFDTEDKAGTRARKAKKSTRTLPLSYKHSENSLLLLTCSVCVSLSLNCVLQFFFYFDILTMFSFLVRGFVYDVLAFVPTWVFYLTHPVFKSITVVKHRSAAVVSNF